MHIRLAPYQWRIHRGGGRFGGLSPPQLTPKFKVFEECSGPTAHHRWFNIHLAPPPRLPKAPPPPQLQNPGSAPAYWMAYNLPTPSTRVKTPRPPRALCHLNTAQGYSACVGSLCSSQPPFTLQPVGELIFRNATRPCVEDNANSAKMKLQIWLNSIFGSSLLAICADVSGITEWHIVILRTCIDLELTKDTLLFNC